MKKDMTTFEMAQAAYENPGKVFVSQCGINACFEGGLFWCDTAINDAKREMYLLDYQSDGYVWNEKVEPRKWSGEYTIAKYRGCNAIDDGLGVTDVVPKDVRRYRVKWEADEVL